MVNVEILEEEKKEAPLKEGDYIILDGYVALVLKINDHTINIFDFKSSKQLTLGAVKFKHFYGTITIICKRD